MADRPNRTDDDPPSPSGKPAPREGARGRSERRKPTPVRAMASAEAPPSPTEPDVAQVDLAIDEVDWVVRVIGRSGGTATSATPLLLLGFWRAEGAEGAKGVEGEHEMEVFVVGRALSDLSRATLEAALGKAEKPGERPPRGQGAGRKRPSGRGSPRGGRDR